MQDNRTEYKHVFLISLYNYKEIKIKNHKNVAIF